MGTKKIPGQCIMKEKINANTAEFRTLSSLCDTLLPKLLSGELSVAETLTT
jgi:hypothetical protein